MKNLILLFFSALSFCSRGQVQNGHICIGSADSIYSKILKEKREIWVHVPENASMHRHAKYPVIFVLDGDEFFQSTVSTVHFLSRNGICPDAIVIGIPGKDRMRDMTPWHDSTVPADSDLVRTSGGGERFTSFLEQELIPYVEAHYPAAPYRMLIGHSLGGLLVLNTLISHTGMFHSYVAIDPAIYWAGQRLLKEAEAKLKQKSYENTKLYIGVSGARPDVAFLMNDKTLSTIYERSIIEFDEQIKAMTGSGVSYKQQYYDHETHNTITLPAIYDALHFVFDFLAMPAMQRDTITTACYSSHYQMVSQKMGYIVLPPEDLINNMGYYFLQKKMFAKAYNFFQMNMANYPESYNVYDSMSDLYAAENDSSKAIEYLMKELAITDQPYIRQKLAELKGSK